MDFEKIKYRAWHKERKTMFPVSEIDFRKKRIKGMAKEGVIVARVDEVTLMPYLLDDSSGNPVYENDIVKVYQGDGGYNSAVFSVMVDDYSFRFRDENNHNEVLYADSFPPLLEDTFIVIGNIFEGSPSILDGE